LDYFQYDDALRTITALRRQTMTKRFTLSDGAILESKHQLPAAITEYVRRSATTIITLIES